MFQCFRKTNKRIFLWKRKILAGAVDAEASLKFDIGDIIVYVREIAIAYLIDGALLLDLTDGPHHA